MSLTEFIDTTLFQIQTAERWSVIGPEAEAVASKLMPNSTWLPFNQIDISLLNGLFLVEVLSTTSDPLVWLVNTINLMADGATLLVVDWQDDGPPNYGPNLGVRFKKGQLCRLLRESGFGVVDTLEHHPLYYIVRGIKKPPPSLPYANQFVDVAGLDELPKNAMKKVSVFEHDIVIANTGKEIVAFAQICPHASGPFDKGLLRGRNVVCPLHAYIWNVRTGEPVEPTNEDILRRYSVRVESDRILVALASP